MQLSLCVSGIKHCVLQELQANIKNYIMSCKGLFSIYEKDDFLYFLIVINDKDLLLSESHIKKMVANCLIDSYKYKLIEENLNYDFVKDIKYYTLVEALLNFDRACDEQYIIDKLDFSSGEVYLQSFFYFYLKILREKWLQLISITNQNSKVLNIMENYVEVLKFLLDGIDRKEDIDVEEQDNHKLKVQKSKQILVFNTYRDLISYIIKNNPKEIKLKNVDKEFANFIKQLFLTRVTLGA